MHIQPRADSGIPQLLLFVDPDADTFDLYRQFLVPRRYIVEHATDGREALAKALTDPPDLVVTESSVPGLDGITLCELLRSDPATRLLPIIVLTAEARPSLDEAARRAGATRVLTKPCLPDALWRELQDVRREGPAAVQRPPVEHRLNASLARRHERYVTTRPSLTPPPLHCPQCDAMLAYDRSHIGGVTAKLPEQWDYYRCPTGCGTYQYRHRTRKVTRTAA
jgi:two-component system cell cycle response regulator DivK